MPKRAMWAAIMVINAALLCPGPHAIAPAMAGDAGNVLQPVPFSALTGWTRADHLASLKVFARSCSDILKTSRAFAKQPAYGGEQQDWLSVCTSALELAPVAGALNAKAFFETWFTPFAVTGKERPEGLFTGYFEPEVKGSLHRTKDYPVPVYARPDDLVTFDKAAGQKTGLRYGRMVDGIAQAYLTRQQIERGGLAGKGLELVWLASYADAFFVHIQGSGRVRLTDGSVMRLAYAGKTGLAYTAIGAILVDRGHIAKPDISMQSIRAWLDANPKEARQLMWANKSFVFFRKVPISGPAPGPPGGQLVGLTPLYSLAVDRRFWAYGTPLWLETTIPAKDNSTGPRPFCALMVAQDTGSAIRGRVRGDVFFGSGDNAAFAAGHMKAPGKLFALLPAAAAARLGLARPTVKPAP